MRYAIGMALSVALGMQSPFQAQGAQLDSVAVAASVGATEPTVFDTYLPLRNATLTYDCGGGVQATTTERQYDVAAEYQVTYGFSGTSSPVRSFTRLEGHDTDGNGIMLGYFHLFVLHRDA